MMFATLAAGLNRQGLMLTWDLNPRYTQTLAIGELAEVRVFVLADGAITLFSLEGKVFEPDESSFHPDDDACLPDQTQTDDGGLDPQADPPKEFSPDESSSHVDDDCGPEHVPTAAAGVGPQPDPQKLFEDK